MEKCRLCHQNMKIPCHNEAKQSRCSVYINYKKSVLTEEMLMREYISNGKSAKQISDEYKIGVNPIITALRGFNIPTRSIKQAKIMPKCKEKTTNTNIKRYGAPHNFCRKHESRIKWQKRLLEEEGITTVWQRQSVIDKIIKTISENPLLKKSRYGSRISKPHKKIIAELKNRNIDIEIEYGILKPTGKKYYYDIFIKNTNILIEINGDYFHANPKIYKKGDYLNHLLGPIPVIEIWKKDRKKMSLARKKGFKVLVFWENEVNLKVDKVVTKILEAIYENQNDSKNRS